MSRAGVRAHVRARNPGPHTVCSETFWAKLSSCVWTEEQRTGSLSHLPGSSYEVGGGSGAGGRGLSTR